MTEIYRQTYKETEIISTAKTALAVAQRDKKHAKSVANHLVSDRYRGLIRCRPQIRSASRGVSDLRFKSHSSLAVASFEPTIGGGV